MTNYVMIKENNNMNKNKYIKLLSIVFIFVFIIVSVISVIMAENELHTEHCNDIDCPICSLICISTLFLKVIEIFKLSYFGLIGEILLLQILVTKIQKIRKQTLVELKVVQIK